MSTTATQPRTSSRASSRGNVANGLTNLAKNVGSETPLLKTNGADGGPPVQSGPVHTPRVHVEKITHHGGHGRMGSKTGKMAIGALIVDKLNDGHAYTVRELMQCSGAKEGRVDSTLQAARLAGCRFVKTVEGEDHEAQIVDDFLSRKQEHLTKDILLEILHRGKGLRAEKRIVLTPDNTSWQRDLQLEAIESLVRFAGITTEKATAIVLRAKAGR